MFFYEDDLSFHLFKIIVTYQLDGKRERDVRMGNRSNGEDFPGAELSDSQNPIFLISV